jgi:hypothetical protein
VPGSFAAPAFIVPAQASKVEASFLAGVGGNPLIPFGFMYLGLGIRVRGNFIKNDADVNAALFRIALGRFNSLGNDIIWQVQTGSVAGHEIPVDRTAFVTKLGAYGTAVYTTMGAAKLHTAATQATDASADRNTSFTTTADNYCVFSAVPNNTLNVASASAALINFSISLVAA